MMAGGLVAVLDCEVTTGWKLCVRVMGRRGNGVGDPDCHLDGGTDSRRQTLVVWAFPERFN